MLSKSQNPARVNFYISPTAIKVQNLEKYFLTAVEYTSYNHLIHQFQSLPGSTKRITHALQDKNKNRNKDRTNVPCDDSRVVLSKMDGMGTDDYINASYINGYDRPKTYIATQGPKFYTTKDFWRMIWTEKVETVIMATDFIESNRRKCAEYFPQMDNAIFECGQMSIKLISKHIHEHYTSRTFEVSYNNINRRVLHLHFKWNLDVCAPTYANHVVAIVKRIRQIRENSYTPIVVHCRGGVSRTGILILCDLALQMAKNENIVDFYILLKNMRNQRPNMIVNQKEYMFAHLVVLECLMEEEQPLRKSYESTDLESHLKYLGKLERHDKVVQSWSHHANKLNDCLLPHVLVDGYAKIRKYLVIQQPEKHHVHIFWDAIIAKKIEAILFLNKTTDEVCPYSRQDSVTTITVQEVEAFRTEYCTSTKLSVVKTHLPTKRVIFKHTVFFFQMHTLDLSLNLKNTNGLLNIAEDIYKSCQSEKQIVVACYDGMTTSGLFLALSYIIEKYHKEVEIDVCNAIRTIRRSGRTFIKTKGQLEILYKAVQEYLQKFDSYSSVL